MGDHCLISFLLEKCPALIILSEDSADHTMRKTQAGGGAHKIDALEDVTKRRPVEGKLKIKNYLIRTTTSLFSNL